jgi:hypothetical protein
MEVKEFKNPFGKVIRKNIKEIDDLDLEDKLKLAKKIVSLQRNSLRIEMGNLANMITKSHEISDRYKITSTDIDLFKRDLAGVGENLKNDEEKKKERKKSKRTKRLKKLSVLIGVESEEENNNNGESFELDLENDEPDSTENVVDPDALTLKSHIEVEKVERGKEMRDAEYQKIREYEDYITPETRKSTSLPTFSTDPITSHQADEIGDMITLARVREVILHRLQRKVIKTDKSAKVDQIRDFHIQSSGEYFKSRLTRYLNKDDFDALKQEIPEMQEYASLPGRFKRIGNIYKGLTSKGIETRVTPSFISSKLNRELKGLYMTNLAFFLLKAKQSTKLQEEFKKLEADVEENMRILRDKESELQELDTKKNDLENMIEAMKSTNRSADKLAEKQKQLDGLSDSIYELSSEINSLQLSIDKLDDRKSVLVHQDDIYANGDEIKSFMEKHPELKTFDPLLFLKENYKADYKLVRLAKKNIYRKNPIWDDGDAIFKDVKRTLPLNIVADYVKNSRVKYSILFMKDLIAWVLKLSQDESENEGNVLMFDPIPDSWFTKAEALQPRLASDLQEIQIGYVKRRCELLRLLFGGKKEDPWCLRQIAKLKEASVTDPLLKDNVLATESIEKLEDQSKRVDLYDLASEFQIDTQAKFDDRGYLEDKIVEIYPNIVILPSRSSSVSASLSLEPDYENGILSLPPMVSEHEYSTETKKLYYTKVNDLLIRDEIPVAIPIGIDKNGKVVNGYEYGSFLNAFWTDSNLNKGYSVTQAITESIRKIPTSSEFPTPIGTVRFVKRLNKEIEIFENAEKNAKRVFPVANSSLFPQDETGDKLYLSHLRTLGYINDEYVPYDKKIKLSNMNLQRRQLELEEARNSESWKDVPALVEARRKMIGSIKRWRELAAKSIDKIKNVEEDLKVKALYDVKTVGILDVIHFVLANFTVGKAKPLSLGKDVYNGTDSLRKLNAILGRELDMEENKKTFNERFIKAVYETIGNFDPDDQNFGRIPSDYFLLGEMNSSDYDDYIIRYTESVEKYRREVARLYTLAFDNKSMKVLQNLLKMTKSFSNEK